MVGHLWEGIFNLEYKPGSPSMQPTLDFYICYSQFLFAFAWCDSLYVLEEDQRKFYDLVVSCNPGEAYSAFHTRNCY
jgi:hypothetical protein